MGCFFLFLDWIVWLLNLFNINIFYSRMLVSITISIFLSFFFFFAMHYGALLVFIQGARAFAFAEPVILPLLLETPPVWPVVPYNQITATGEKCIWCTRSFIWRWLRVSLSYLPGTPAVTGLVALCPTAIKKHSPLSGAFHHRPYQCVCFVTVIATLLKLKLSKQRRIFKKKNTCIIK